jgi:mannose-1-phosphate guanylyltransferase
MFEDVVGVILSGGEGRRLRPLTYYFQKCMIPVGTKQKPLLEYIIHHHKKHNVRKLKMLVGYKNEQITNYFGDGNRFGVEMEYYVDDPQFQGSAGSLLNAYQKCAFEDIETILIYYGDILSTINLTEMLSQHQQNEAYATLAVTKGYKVPVGVAKVHDKEVIEWVEKPEIDILAGIGVLVIDPDSLDILEKQFEKTSSIDIMGGFVPELLRRKHSVMVYETIEFWYDVGSTEKYEKIDNGLIDKLFN